MYTYAWRSQRISWNRARRSIAIVDVSEQARIELLEQRYGIEEAKRWARRTAAIYRAAVLDPNHFAHERQHRRQFIESYKELKRYAAH
jgi:hypothetical protein